MIRLLLLLLGSNVLRRHWWVPTLLSAVALAGGVVFILHLLHLPIVIVTDVIGGLFVLESALRLLKLAAIGFPNATGQVMKALAYFFFGLLAIDVPWDDNIVATYFFGAIFVMDGTLRIASALVIRALPWRRLLALGLANLVIGALILSPWPVPNRHTVPFCIGLALLPAAWSLLVLGLQLRRLPAGSSVTELPIFRSANWHGRGVFFPAAIPDAWEQPEPLTVHVWTPTGSAQDVVRRPIVDRYIAAMDRNGTIMTGHAALSVASEDYVSLYPAKEVEYNPRAFTRMLRAVSANDVPGEFRPSFVAECAEWCPPDREVVFYRYNRAGLIRFIDEYKTRAVYNLTNRNCSSSVALCLDVAMEGTLDHRRWWLTILRLMVDPAMWLLVLWRARAEAMTWTPGLLLDYATALRGVMNGERRPWLIRLMQNLQIYQARRQVELKVPQPEPRAGLASVISLVATGVIFGLAYGLSSPLIALVLTRMGHSDGFVGANAAMHAAGVLAIAPFLPGLSWRAGPKLPMCLALLAASAVLMAFASDVPVWMWFPLRLLLGAASETMLVLSEAWLNQLSTDSNRTRNVAIFTCALSLGFAIGPMLLTVLGSDGPAPFIAGSLIALLALLSMAMPWVKAPSFAAPQHSSILPYLWLAPVALAATLINAAVESAGMSFLPLYAMQVGWAESNATLLLSVLLVGAIVLQLPIAWLGDRTDRRRLSAGLAVASALGALAWPSCIAIPYLAYPLLFVWGGAFVGIYTLMSAEVGSRFKGGDLVAVYVVMSVAWGCGALVGPASAGIAMSASHHGLPYLISVVCALFALFVALGRSRLRARRTVSLGQHHERQTPMAGDSSMANL